LAAELIAIDTTNTGDADSKGERAAAEHVMACLTEAGYAPVCFESEPRRATVVQRIEGWDPWAPALVVHGHLDVVPADASDWTVPPFAGELRDGELWGRGAVDMKDMVGMMLAIAADWARSGARPRRDIVLAFFADEEAGGWLGAHWTVDHRPELLAGATEAVGEVGGFSTMVGARRAYLIQTAEKGLMWLRLVARGTAGHGSAANPDNAVRRLAEAASRVAAHAWPVDLTGTVRALLQGVAELTGLPYSEDPADLEALVAALGPARRFVGSSLATASNLTGLAAGYKANVVPSRAEATLDVRPIPGTRDQVAATLAREAGDGIVLEFANEGIGTEAPFETALVDRMADALGAADPGAAVLPYMLSAGTDAKALARLGIRGYGFVPLRLPADFDFTAMFHGVDERVPVAAVEFGARVLRDFLLTA
jgi:acetylornithine deacetylase/succinyl-diaminopimelate desuccinylase-like protein